MGCAKDQWIGNNFGKNVSEEVIFKETFILWCFTINLTRHTNWNLNPTHKTHWACFETSVLIRSHCRPWMQTSWAAMFLKKKKQKVVRLKPVNGKRIQFFTKYRSRFRFEFHAKRKKKDRSRHSEANLILLPYTCGFGLRLFAICSSWNCSLLSYFY